MPRLLALSLAVGLVGCSQLQPKEPPPTFLLSWLDANAPARVVEHERRQGTIRIESDALSGTYAFVLVRRRGERPAARLQLFPEVGGRVLDLVATSTSFEGVIPPADRSESWRQGEGKPPRHLFAFLAASLVAEGEPLGADRALGAAPGPSGRWRVRLSVPFPELELVASLDPFGAVEGYEFTLRGVRWRELTRSPDQPRTFVGRGIRLDVLEESVTEAEPFDDALFQLGGGS